MPKHNDICSFFLSPNSKYVTDYIFNIVKVNNILGLQRIKCCYNEDMC